MFRNRASREEIAVLARFAGLELKKEHFDDLVESFRTIEPVLQRLPRRREAVDEPGHIFDPRRFMPKGNAL